MKAASELRKPVLLIDVDGVISLWGFDVAGRPEGTFASVDGVPHFLSAEAGRHLHDLADAFELVWCTGWEEKANEYLPSLLGLPGPLPYLSFDRHVISPHPPTTMPGHWKLGAIDAYVGRRTVAWIDDAFNDACHTWARDRPSPTLLVETEPSRGLIAEHATLLKEWSRAHSEPAS
jgi:hypothetical protein